LQAQINNLPFDGGSDQIKQSATNAIGLLDQFISNISSNQSSLTAAKDTLNVSLSTSNDVEQKAQKTIDKIQNVDITALQMQLQQLNNQQTLDFQVTSQLRTMASSILSIFR
jgi:flagellin-like hook-associated protein FlgL